MKPQSLQLGYNVILTEGEYLGAPPYSNYIILKQIYMSKVK